MKTNNLSNLQLNELLCMYYEILQQFKVYSHVSDNEVKYQKLINNRYLKLCKEQERRENENIL